MRRPAVSLALFVALRYLRSSRKDAFVTFLSLTAAGGVAVGVAALVLALAALSGFQTALREEVLERTPQIEISLPPTAEIDAELSKVSGAAGVSKASQLARGRGWLLAAGRARPVEIVGFGGSLPGQFPRASSRQSGLYLSTRLVDSWGLEAGETVELVSPLPTLTPLGPQPRIQRLPLVGVFASGRAEQEERAAVPLEAAVELFGKGSRRIVVECGDLQQALSVARRLESSLPEGSLVTTWRESNRALLFALRLEKSLIFISVFLIVVVAAMALVSDLMLILASRQPEIGMLGAMGARPMVLQRIFLWLGGLLVVVGAGVGLVVGVGGAWVLDRYRLLALPEQVYFLDHVPFLVRPQDVAAIVLTTLALSLFCAWLAAARAAALQPVEALRR